MSIYKRDDVFPEWEPVPWDLKGEAADEQEREFHQRATKAIAWTKFDPINFPATGIFGMTREWFLSNDIEFYASFDHEDLVLTQNTFHGFPDPPEWGLASRPSGDRKGQWTRWGYFANFPAAWTFS
jgi:hypothetical protein